MADSGLSACDPKRLFLQSNILTLILVLALMVGSFTRLRARVQNPLGKIVKPYIAKCLGYLS